jgi:hypothetical protein
MTKHKKTYQTLPLKSTFVLEAMAVLERDTFLVECFKIKSLIGVCSVGS